MSLCSVACHTAAGHPSVPNFVGEMPPIMEHMSPFPARHRRQPAQAEAGGGWHGKERGDHPGNVIGVQHAESQQMQKAS